MAQGGPNERGTKMTQDTITRKAEHLTNFTADFLEQLIAENELYIEAVAHKQFMVDAAKLALELKAAEKVGA